MDLDIARSFSSRVLTPYVFKGRTYYLMFFKRGIEGPFYVCDSPYELSQAMFSLGDIRKKSNDEVVGNILYTTANAHCFGAYAIAYSGQFKVGLDTSIPKDFNMDLVLKTDYLQVFNKRNRATLVVSPNLNSSIRQNLEV